MATVSLIYCITSCFSLLLLIGYSVLIHKKEPWFYLLFASVLVVNIGYFTLSISKTLDEALLANRISYFGSVFLPMAMLMIIFNVTDIKHKIWLPSVLVTIGVVVFLVAASPGYLDIYYKEVSLQTINGVIVLQKVYGEWHKLYMFYLLGYFLVMISLSIYAFKRKKLVSPVHCVFLVVAVFVNICVWLIEQLIKIEFEFLSVSYIISELFLLSLYMLLQYESISKKPSAILPEEANSEVMHDKDLELLQQEFRKGVLLLTKSEKNIYRLYLENKSTKEILSELNITENTLKFHNKNIYSKLGVSSRKQLKQIAKTL